LLAEAGHSAEHLRDLGLSRAPDHEVLATATTTGAVLVSSDTDFGELLARFNAAGPSVILLRRQEGRRADDIAALIIANLDAVADDLSAGALVVLDNERIRIRSLPFRPEN
jgi:predicted nuclease of predicted toxin-antitoxin system